MRILLCWLLASIGTLLAQPVRNEDPSQRERLVVDLISIPRATAFELVRLPSHSVWARLLEMMKEGAAESEYVIASVASHGYGSTFESSEERMISTSFIPPEVDDGTIPTVTAADVIRMSVVPGAFEFHRVGTELEAYTVTRGDFVEISFFLKLKEFDCILDFPLRKYGLFPSIGIPSFRSVNVGRQKITGRLGSPLFIQAAEFSRAELTGPRDRVLLAFVTAIID